MWCSGREAKVCVSGASEPGSIHINTERIAYMICRPDAGRIAFVTCRPARREVYAIRPAQRIFNEINISWT